MSYYERLLSLQRHHERLSSVRARERKWAWEASRFKTWYLDSKTNKLSEIYMSKSIKDLLTTTDVDVNLPAANDAYVAENFPNTFALLTVQSLGKGKPRTPSTLFIFAAGGAWKICLGDKDGNRCLWAESDTLAGCTKAIELLLDMPIIPWKPKTFAPANKR